MFTGIDTAVDRVVLVLIDGYGLHSWRRDRDDHQFLDRLTERGTVTPLTSVYPSETAAAITTLETGQLPCEHGRIGWNVYDPAIDRSFLALDGTVKTGTNDVEQTDRAWEGVEYCYTDFAAADVDCHRLQPFQAETDGLTQHSYDDLSSFGTRLASIAAQSTAPAYIYAYLPIIDTVSHTDGTDSVAFQRTVGSVCDQLERFLAELPEGTARETLLLVAADHGHVDTDPARNVDLSTRPDLIDNLRRRPDGSPVKLAGSPRNAHLHLQPGSREEVAEALADLDAHLFTRDDVRPIGLFGHRPASRTFDRRCGDLVLSHHRLGTWYGDVEPEELDQVGMHGGLHPAEMLVPFAACRADRL